MCIKVLTEINDPDCIVMGNLRIEVPSMWFRLNRILGGIVAVTLRYNQDH